MPKKNKPGPQAHQGDVPQVTTDELAAMVENAFDHMGQRLDRLATKDDVREVIDRLDRIEFLVSGQDRRVAILEDRMRQVVAKVGLEFSPTTPPPAGAA